MDVRNLLYDRDVLKSYPLGARTISVGNLTTGGTGKTPLVALTAEMLIEKGEKVCILTRGYGREHPKRRVLVCDGESVLVDARTGGDEPVELAYNLNGKAVIVADADRVKAAIWAREKFGITTFVLDDGFQHRRAKRDLDIVCIDATNPCGNGRILPAGNLRESFSGLNRASSIVITRSDQSDGVEKLKQKLREQNGSAPIFENSTKIGSLVPIEEFSSRTRNTKSEKAWNLLAFSGIGNPDSFVTTLKRAGYEVADTRSFPDHYRYTQSDILELEKQAVKSGVGALVTTAKDAVKLSYLKFSVPCYVTVAETVIDDLEAFRDLVVSS